MNWLCSLTSMETYEQKVFFRGKKKKKDAPNWPLGGVRALPMQVPSWLMALFREILEMNLKHPRISSNIDFRDHLVQPYHSEARFVELRERQLSSYKLMISAKLDLEAISSLWVRLIQSSHRICLLFLLCILVCTTKASGVRGLSIGRDQKGLEF